MHRQQMLEILFDLKKQLKQSSLEAGDRQRMEALAEEIERRVHASDNDLSGDEYLLKKVAEAIEEYEADHPAVTNIMGRISDLLARIGL